jgi:hypothetical protein
MVMSWDQNAGQNHSTKIDNSSFERVEEFKYLGANLRYQNSIQEEIKNRMRSGNACYHLVHNLLSSILYAFSWVIPWHLNFICQCFGTLCLFHLHRQVGMTRLWRWNTQTVPKHWHIKLPRRKHTTFGIQRKFEIQNFVFQFALQKCKN